MLRVFKVAKFGLKNGKIFERIRRMCSTQDQQEESVNFLNTLFYAPAANSPDCAIGSVSRDALLVSDSVVESFLEVKHVEEVQVRGVKHLRLTELGQLHAPIDPEKYFQHFKDHKNRNLKDLFNRNVLSTIKSTQVFSDDERRYLFNLDADFKKNIEGRSDGLVRKEVRRMSLDYIWKSCELEGSTYSIFDTEVLLENGFPAGNRPYSEAQMAINHMKALRLVSENNVELFKVLDLNLIQQVHALMMEGTGISSMVRKDSVRISSTRYVPPKNEKQLMEILAPTLETINAQGDIFSKALVTTMLLSYLQLFDDGNKRTARMLSNGTLLSNGSFPLGYDGVSEKSYKHAIIMFYERNNIHAFKQLFLQQAKTSVENYFV